MQLQEITMPREQAREAFREYRTAVRERHDAEDRSIMRAYRELSEGRHLIRLSETVRLGGWEVREFTDRRWRRPETVRATLPRLAVVRADAAICFTNGVMRDGSIRFRSKHAVHVSNRRDRVDLEELFTDLPEDGPFPEGSWDRSDRARFRALAPLVPPPLRPAQDLSGFHILFEAEWALARPSAPVDPALIKHIGGDLWAVHAVWDLTEVERAVLSGRAVEA